MTTNAHRRMARLPTTLLRLALLALLSPLVACPPSGECTSDEDCAAGEACRQLQAAEERVCIEVLAQQDAGPDEADPVVIDELTADDDVVPAGGKTTLRWTARNATSCAFNEGIGGVAAEGDTEVTVARATEYTLSCQGAEGPALESVTVAVELAILDVSVDDAEVNIGDEVTASWQSIGATSCTVNAPGFELDVPAAELEEGQATFSPSASGEVQLACEGASGSREGSTAVDVARIASFTATPTTTTAGGTVTLAWVGENVTACAVDGVSDADTSDSEVDVTVDASSDYTLTCTGFDDVDIQATASLTVE